MTAVAIVRSEWSGLSGGPGLTQMAVARTDGTPFTAANAQSASNAVRTFWDSLKAYLPTDVTILVRPELDVYDSVSTQLQFSTTVSSPAASVVGTSTSGYAAGAGVKIDWNTSTVLDGRRVKGHTYVVPTTSAVYDVDGTPSALTVTTFNNAAQALVTALNGAGVPLQVWRRGPRKFSTGGQLVSVLNGSARDKTAFLRQRRD